MNHTVWRKGITQMMIMEIIAVIIILLSALIIYEINLAPEGSFMTKISSIVMGYEEEASKLGDSNSCIILEDPDIAEFNTNSVNAFSVEMGEKYKVTDVSHFSILFIEDFGLFTGWHLDSWKVTCFDGANTYTLVDQETDLDIEDITNIQKTANALYHEDVECGTRVDVYVKTGDKLLDGTSGTVKLCFYKDR